MCRFAQEPGIDGLNTSRVSAVKFSLSGNAERIIELSARHDLTSQSVPPERTEKQVGQAGPPYKRAAGAKMTL